MSIEPSDDEVLLARFRDWLRANRLEAESLQGAPDPSRLEPGPEPEVGLFRLVEEFTALRHEMKLETKGSRNLGEQVEALLPVLRQAIDQIRSVVPREEQVIQAVARPLAEGLADLDEALDRGRLEIEKARDRLAASAASIEADLDRLFTGQRWYRRFWLRPYHQRTRELVGRRAREAQDEIFAALLEGYALIQGRLKRAMDSGQVGRIDCVGRAVDPTRMTVIEAVETTDQPPGYVVDEVRRGYSWRGRVLRYAEVRAAREQQAGRPSEVEPDAQDEEEVEANEVADQGADGGYGTDHRN
jgi:molecular chaperone GrpE